MNRCSKCGKALYGSKALDWGNPKPLMAEKDGHVYQMVEGKDGMWNLEVDGKVIGKPVGSPGDLMGRAESTAKKIAKSGPPVKDLLDWKGDSDGM